MRPFVFGFALCTVVLFIGCQSNNQVLQDRVDSLETANQELRRDVQTLQDSLRGNQSGTTLSPAIHFPSGSAWIPDRGRRQLDKHAQTLKEEHPNADYQIKGYTDPVPIGPSLKDTYPSNWYLSAQRAAAVAHYLNKNHGLRTESIEIEAFGPRTQATDERPEPRREDRRVEIVVAVDT